MAGFDNDIAYAKNADFTQADNQNVLENNGLILDNQVWLGATAANAGGTHINVTTLTAGTGISLTRNTGVTPNTLTIANTASTTDLHTARYIVSVGGAANGANFTTLSAAYTAASAAGSPQTVFLQPGTYTENITLNPGINLSAYSCDSSSPNVTILGKLSYSSSGKVAISGIELKTNADFALSITGSTNSIVDLINCKINGNNNNPIQFTSSSGSSKINFLWSRGDIANTFAYCTHSGAGKLFILDCYFENNGGSTTASTVSGSGALELRNSYWDNGITTSSTANLIINNSEVHSVITANGTGASNAISNSSLIAGTSSSLSIGVGATMKVINCEISSSNTNAITGAGALIFGGLVFSDTSSLINTTTQTPDVSSNDAIRITTPGAYPYTTVPQDGLIKVDTSSARTIIPLASPTTGQKHIIKDTVGSAAANNITITPSGKNIDGAASATININYGSATIVYTGTEWSFI